MTTHLLLFRLDLGIDCTLHSLQLLIILLQESIKARSILCQHLLALGNCILSQRSALLQLVELLALVVHCHLDKENFPLLGYEVPDVYLLR